MHINVCLNLYHALLSSGNGNDERLQYKYFPTEESCYRCDTILGRLLAFWTIYGGYVHSTLDCMQPIWHWHRSSVSSSGSSELDLEI